MLIKYSWARFVVFFSVLCTLGAILGGCTLAVLLLDHLNP